jgi:putative acetyltransferase
VALFVDAAWLRRGIGRRLAGHAIHALGATTVEVNEQNPEAVAFYERMGFRVEGRTPTDHEGRPFPLLQMRLAPGP